MQNSVGLRILSDIPIKSLKNQRVLVRADFNVPIGNNRIIDSNEDWRIKAAIPTIKYLVKAKAKVILLSHMGRPGGKIIEKLRLEPIQIRLSELLGVSIKKTSDCVGKNTRKAITEMSLGEILLLENLRFHKEEEENNDEFAKELAALGDFYINDAFSDSHRKHASIVGITKYLPSYAGLLMEKELKMLNEAVHPKLPAIAIIGGAKLETKLPAVQSLAKIYDCVLVGGMIANEIKNTFLGKTIAKNVVLPINNALSKQKYFDINDNSVREFEKIIRGAKSIIWNGPMGKFEEEEFSNGTRGVINAIKIAHENGAWVLVGGGETIAALQRFAPELINKKIKKINISTGGGAMLEFLTGKNMPGIEALKKNF